MKIECLILCVKNKKNRISIKKIQIKFYFFNVFKFNPMPDQQRFLHFLKREAEDPIR